MNKIIIGLGIVAIVGLGLYAFNQNKTQPPTSEAESQLGETLTSEDIQVTPIAIVEDSRCPTDVQCIWAGRLVVKTELKSGTVLETRDMELGVGTTFQDKEITLASATPHPKSGKLIDKNDYRLKYNVEKLPDTPTSSGGYFVGGCSSQLCSDEEGMVSTCEYRQEYACYKTAKCERQSNGKCGWTPTSELNLCLGSFR